MENRASQAAAAAAACQLLNGKMVASQSRCMAHQGIAR